MLPEGISIRVGRWTVPGKPIAVLVKFDGMYASKDEAYGRMWELFGVDSLHAYGDYDEGCAFARAAAVVILALTEFLKARPANVIAHFDEWTTAMGLLEVKAAQPEIATVFTTHATSIGRSICGNGKPLYSQLSAYDGDQMARELNMESKHSLEKAAAWNADCFTTVSDVTAAEAAQLLGKQPDVITPNGFEPNFVPAKTKYKKVRQAAREHIFDVMASLTGVELPADTFMVATSGRCEYRNKGLDMFLDVCDGIRNSRPARKVLAMVLVPAWCAGPRQDLMHAMTVNSHQRLSDPVLTHALNNYGDDAVNKRLHELGFNNDAESGIITVYVPCYLDGADGIFGLTYYDMLPAFDATVFASYYEPWGYTPLESIAFGVPTVSTTLAGFGAWILNTWPGAGFDVCGTQVVERTDTNYSQSVADISKALESLEKMSASEIEDVRKAAMEASRKADWALFIKDYEMAYCVAFGNRNNRLKK